MKNMKWYLKALILGGVFFIAALIVQPVGVSTQFSVVSGMIHSVVDPSVITEDQSRDTGYSSTNAYYDRRDGKLAEEIKHPWNYGFVFVLSIPLGACAGYFISKSLGERRRQTKQNLNSYKKDSNRYDENEEVDTQNMIKDHINEDLSEEQGCNVAAAKNTGFFRRYLPPFLGGFFLLYGARMADGCTSGHMMSGMMQGSVSGYLFAAAVFAVAIPVAIIIGNRKSKENK